ncbi:MAG TPA: hypothetical protein VEX86_03410 [Longimicrobium sp.]|nr:hypothetical protein [Longimicrobium sp.]
MKKLNLDLAELAVESFETFVAERDRGTVRANGGCVTWSCGTTCGMVPDSEIAKHGVNAVSYPRNCCV